MRQKNYFHVRERNFHKIAFFHKEIVRERMRGIKNLTL